MKIERVILLGFVCWLYSLSQTVNAQQVETGYNSSFVVPIELQITGPRSAPVSVFAEDINKNGEEDIILVRENAIHYFYQLNGSFSIEGIQTIPPRSSSENFIGKVVDFNGDGYKDYLYTDFRYYLSTGFDKYELLQANYIKNPS